MEYAVFFTFAMTQSELPDLLAVFAGKFKEKIFFKNLFLWENVVFSLFIIAAISIIAFLAARRLKMIPGKLQNFVELIAEGIDNFICSMLGAKGRKFIPFLGTLFIYILLINVSGLIPFFKAATSSLSTTLALSICVFVYVQWTAIKELGFLGYFDHLAGKPRGMIAFSCFIPVLMFSLHILTELIRPLSLSLRLRSNIWGDDLLLAVLSGFGIKGLPLLFLNMAMAALTAVVQAVVFCLLSTIYFALVLTHEEKLA